MKDHSEKIMEYKSSSLEDMFLIFNYTPLKHRHSDKYKINNTRSELETLKYFHVFCFLLTKVY